MRHVAVAALLTLFIANAAQAEPVAPAPADSAQAAVAAQKVAEPKAAPRHTVAWAHHRAQELRFWAEVRRRKRELARLFAQPPVPVLAPIEATRNGPAPLVEAAAIHSGCGSISCSRYVLLGVGY